MAVATLSLEAERSSARRARLSASAACLARYAARTSGAMASSHPGTSSSGLSLQALIAGSKTEVQDSSAGAASEPSALFRLH